jgi:hypothetical protein
MHGPVAYLVLYRNGPVCKHSIYLHCFFWYLSIIPTAAPYVLVQKKHTDHTRIVLVQSTLTMRMITPNKFTNGLHTMKTGFVYWSTRTKASSACQAELFFVSKELRLIMAWDLQLFALGHCRQNVVALRQLLKSLYIF